MFLSTVYLGVSQYRWLFFKDYVSVWWHTSVMEHWRRRQRDHKVESDLSYVVSSRQAWETQ